MLSDAFSEATDRLDHYLADPEWRGRYDARTLARADVLRAGMDALRGYLDVLPESATVLEAAINGDMAALDAHITTLAQEWRAQPEPNLHFSPTEFRARILAAARLLRAIDDHLVPLLPELQALAPKPPEG